MTTETVYEPAAAKSALRHFILENYLFTDDENELSNDASFLEQGILDSMGILELIDFLKDQFSVVVEDDEMVPDNLDSVDNLLAYLDGKISNN